MDDTATKAHVPILTSHKFEYFKYGRGRSKSLKHPPIEDSDVSLRNRIGAPSPHWPDWARKVAEKLLDRPETTDCFGYGSSSPHLEMVQSKIPVDILSSIAHELIM